MEIQLFTVLMIFNDEKEIVAKTFDWIVVTPTLV